MIIKTVTNIKVNQLPIWANRFMLPINCWTILSLSAKNRVLIALSALFIGCAPAAIYVNHDYKLGYAKNKILAIAPLPLDSIRFVESHKKFESFDTIVELKIREFVRDSALSAMEKAVKNYRTNFYFKPEQYKIEHFEDTNFILQSLPLFPDTHSVVYQIPKKSAYSNGQIPDAILCITSLAFKLKRIDQVMPGGTSSFWGADLRTVLSGKVSFYLWNNIDNRFMAYGKADTVIDGTFQNKLYNSDLENFFEYITKAALESTPFGLTAVPRAFQ
jgi:hypothetical protein